MGAATLGSGIASLLSSASSAVNSAARSPDTSPESDSKSFGKALDDVYRSERRQRTESNATKEQSRQSQSKKATSNAQKTDTTHKKHEVTSAKADEKNKPKLVDKEASKSDDVRSDNVSNTFSSNSLIEKNESESTSESNSINSGEQSGLNDQDPKAEFSLLMSNATLEAKDSLTQTVPLNWASVGENVAEESIGQVSIVVSDTDAAQNPLEALENTLQLNSLDPDSQTSRSEVGEIETTGLSILHSSVANVSEEASESSEGDANLREKPKYGNDLLTSLVNGDKELNALTESDISPIAGADINQTNQINPSSDASQITTQISVYFDSSTKVQVGDQKDISGENLLSEGGLNAEPKSNKSTFTSPLQSLIEIAKAAKASGDINTGTTTGTTTTTTGTTTTTTGTATGSIISSTDTSSIPQINSNTQPSSSLPTFGSQFASTMNDVSNANRSFVPQTTVNASVGQPQWSEQVGEKVLWMASQKLHSADIRLDPPELGPLQVKVIINQDQAQVNFTSHHAQVREVLDQNMNRLREMFSEQGLNLVNVDVSDKSPNRQQQQGQKEQGASANSAEPEEVAAPLKNLTLRLVDHYA